MRKILLVLWLLICLWGCSHTDDYELWKVYVVKTNDTRYYDTELVAKSDDYLVFDSYMNMKFILLEYPFMFSVYEKWKGYQILTWYEDNEQLLNMLIQ